MRSNGIRSAETDPVSEADARFVFEHCEKLGEAGTRKALASSYFGRDHRAMAELWLSQREEARQEIAAKETRSRDRRTELAAWIAVVASVVSIFLAVLALGR